MNNKNHRLTGVRELSVELLELSSRGINAWYLADIGLFDEESGLTVSLNFLDFVGGDDLC